MTKNVTIIPADSTTSIPYCDHLVMLDNNNVMGIELNQNYKIRIDGVTSSDYHSFASMMDALVTYGRTNGYRYIHYADSLSNKMYQFFIKYGYKNENIIGDEWNKYLHYELE